METQDEVREVKVHAISLNRPKRRKRTAPTPPPPERLVSRVFGGLRGGMFAALEPPQQSWLALLGLSSLAIKSTEQVWHALVSEGADVQAQIGRRVAAVARRAGAPFARKGS